MLHRYPHSAKLICKEITTDEGGLVSFSEDCGIRLIGRYELRDKDLTNYSGVFFTRLLDLKKFSLDGAKLKFGDRTFVVSKIPPHQTHTELWLK